ncbi:uncharacterized protein B0T15DRAFT_542724 [Chaetomium strumarium]|uniref:Secreted protein n=1 Tax=Chaetomium strumarium TaxID=1170767 RepID=A0AAJ0LYH8_9PEZI|nr:hypothetical protein B0T15DRAFT_542724 [Chaetomium strumarium]
MYGKLRAWWPILSPFCCPSFGIAGCMQGGSLLSIHVHARPQSQQSEALIGHFKIQVPSLGSGMDHPDSRLSVRLLGEPDVVLHLKC